MGAQFTIPLVTVIPGQLIASALWNNEFQNVNTNFVPAGMDSYSDTDAQMQIQTAPYPGSVTSHASNLGGEIERIRYQISAILGATTPAYWYAKPPIDLTTVGNILVPIGGSILYSSATPPSSNYVVKDGRAISRTTYATLFALISTTFGVGDGSTTFNIPNATDRMPIAAGNLYSLGATGGEATHVLTITEIPSHNHTASSSVTDPGHNHTQTTGNAGGAALPHALSNGAFNNTQDASNNTEPNTTGISVSTTVNVSGGGGGAHNNIPPYLAEYWMYRIQ